MIDNETKKILPVVWCENAPQNRIDPEEVGIDPAIGWTSDYEQNRFPERLIWNELLFRAQSVLREKIIHGVLLWSDEFDYPQYSFVNHEGKLYVCDEAVNKGGSAPNVNDAWREY